MIRRTPTAIAARIESERDSRIEFGFHALASVSSAVIVAATLGVFLLG